MFIVFCLDITKIIPSVSAFQLVHIFILHEAYFSAAWVQTQKPPRMKRKEKKYKRRQIHTELWGKEYCVHLRIRGVNRIMDKATCRISRMSLLTCEINELYISCTSVSNKIWILGQISSWVGEQNCRDEEDFTSSKSDDFFILNSSFKQLLFIITFKCRKPT